MIIKKYPAPPSETAAERYDRDWLNVPDLDTAGKDDYRHDRTLLQQTVERKSRRYVDDGVSAVTGDAPIFGEDGTPEPEPEDSYTELWVETFNGELDSAWTLQGTYDPPGGKPLGDSMFQISRPFKLNNFRIDFELDFPSEPITDGYFIPQVILSSEEAGKVFGLTISVDPETLVRTVLLYDGVDTENSMTFTGDTFSLIQTAEGLKAISGDQTLTSPIFTSIESDGALQVILQTNMGGSIKNIAAYSLSDNNGGGTPEPEEPVVPEGSYQENYTETY